jgi:hypothetical protein
MFWISHGRRSLLEKMMWALRTCSDCGTGFGWSYSLVCPYRVNIFNQKPRALPSARMVEAVGLMMPIVPAEVFEFIWSQCPELECSFVVSLTNLKSHRKANHEQVREETRCKHYLV